MDPIKTAPGSPAEKTFKKAFRRSVGFLRLGQYAIILGVYVAVGRFIFPNNSYFLISCVVLFGVLMIDAIRLLRWRLFMILVILFSLPVVGSVLFLSGAAVLTVLLKGWANTHSTALSIILGLWLLTSIVIGFIAYYTLLRRYQKRVIAEAANKADAAFASK